MTLKLRTPPSSLSVADTPRTDNALRPREWGLVLFLATIQFVNMLDFMMVLPLGGDFARDLHTPLSKLGYVGGAYSAAAAVSGLLCSQFLDRFERRNAITVTLFGLTVGTLLGAYTHSLATMMLARVVAGAFAGPTASLSSSIVSDIVPVARRGRASGIVYAGFALAQLVGIPIALQLAQWSSWRAPFVAVSACGIAVVVAGRFILPSLREHLRAGGATSGGLFLARLMRRPTMLLALWMISALMMAGFLILPNIPSFLVRNLGCARAELPRLYLMSGSMFLVFSLLAGRLVEVLGFVKLGGVAALILGTVTILWFVPSSPLAPAALLFCLWVAAQSVRNVACLTLALNVPAPSERARYVSVQLAVQHGSMAVGAFISARLLHDGAGGKLEGMERTAWITAALSLLLPFIVWRLQRRVSAGLP